MLCLRAHLSFEPRSESFLIFANSLEDCFQAEDTLILQGVKDALFPRMSVSFIFFAMEFSIRIARTVNNFGDP